MDRAINQATTRPSFLTVPTEQLTVEGKIRPVASMSSGAVLRPGDLFASDPVHWVMYIGENYNYNACLRLLMQTCRYHTKPWLISMAALCRRGQLRTHEQ